MPDRTLLDWIGFAIIVWSMLFTVGIWIFLILTIVSHYWEY